MAHWKNTEPIEQKPAGHFEQTVRAHEESQVEQEPAEHFEQIVAQEQSEEEKAGQTPAGHFEQQVRLHEESQVEQEPAAHFEQRTGPADNTGPMEAVYPLDDETKEASNATDGTDDKRFIRTIAVGEGSEPRFSFWCPACGNAHIIQIPPWTFDGNVESPTIGGSIRTGACHSNVTAGKIYYHNDSGHAMRGQQVPMVKF